MRKKIYFILSEITSLVWIDPSNRITSHFKTCIEGSFLHSLLKVGCRQSQHAVFHTSLKLATSNFLHWREENNQCRTLTCVLCDHCIFAMQCLFGLSRELLSSLNGTRNQQFQLGFYIAGRSSILRHHALKPSISLDIINTCHCE